MEPFFDTERVPFFNNAGTTFFSHPRTNKNWNDGCGISVGVVVFFDECPYCSWCMNAKRQKAASSTASSPHPRHNFATNLSLIRAWYFIAFTSQTSHTLLLLQSFFWLQHFFRHWFFFHTQRTGAAAAAAGNPFSFEDQSPTSVEWILSVNV